MAAWPATRGAGGAPPSRVQHRPGSSSCPCWQSQGGSVQGLGGATPVITHLLLPCPHCPPCLELSLRDHLWQVHLKDLLPGDPSRARR